MGLSDSSEFIARRYDRLAPVYRLVEAAFALPPGLKRQAVDKLELAAGQRVVEIGVGSGRNLPALHEAVGDSGAILGLDVSPGMLARARAVVRRRGWRNVDLVEQDAGSFDAAGPFDACLFSLSYSVLPRPEATLEVVWPSLRPGGRVVVLDAGLPPNLLGRLLRRSSVRASKRTVLGDPFARPWEDLERLTTEVTTTRSALGTYYTCVAIKP